jgi:hypothetical protein
VHWSVKNTYLKLRNPVKTPVKMELKPVKMERKLVRMERKLVKMEWKPVKWSGIRSK